MTKARSLKRMPISVKMVKRLAIEFESMAEASTAAKTKRPLNKLMTDYPVLRKAWDRGRFLRNLKELAATAVTIPEAEEALELEAGYLKKEMEEDREVADTWNQARLATTIEIKAALVTAAKEGKPTAIKNVARILRTEIAKTAADLAHVSIAQMIEITGKTRQTVHDWYTKYGLSRNSDKTFNLVQFFGWFEEFTIRKTRGAGKPLALTDPLKAAKAEKLELDLAHQRDQLLDRGAVLAGQLARQQNLVNAISHKAEDLSMLCHGQPPEKITVILSSFFQDLRSQQCQVSEQLRLPPQAAETFRKLLEELRPEGDE